MYTGKCIFYAGWSLAMRRHLALLRCICNIQYLGQCFHGRLTTSTCMALSCTISCPYALSCVCFHRFSFLPTEVAFFEHGIKSMCYVWCRGKRWSLSWQTLLEQRCWTVQTGGSQTHLYCFLVPRVKWGFVSVDTSWLTPVLGASWHLDNTDDQGRWDGTEGVMCLALYT